jgi:hypothetical protein
MSASDPIRRLAERQHGNVTFAQLRAARLTRHQIAHRVKEGWLVPRHTAVYAVGHVPRSRESRWHAAVLALGDAVLSHRAGGAHWAVVGGAVPTEVTVPRDRRPRDGIVIHRAPLPPEHVTTRDGIPVTTLLRTMLDLATVLPTRRLAQAFEEAQVLHHLPPAPLAAEVLARRRYRGNARLRAILDGAVDPAAVKSILELRFLRMCAAHGIPRPLVNEKIGIWTPDFLWPERRLVVETDSVAFHRTPAKKRRDAEKDAFLTDNGYRVLRVSCADVTETPESVARLIR